MSSTTQQGTSAQPGRSSSAPQVRFVLSLLASGIYNNYGNVTLTNVILSGNSVAYNGGGMLSQYGSAVLTNVTITGNRATNAGGGIANYMSSFQIRNSIIWGNIAPIDIAIRNVSGTITGSYSLIEGGYTGTGNINADPLFVTAVPGPAPSTGGDLHLQAGSPAIDAGANSVLPADSADLDRDGDTGELLPLDLASNLRVGGSTVDLGAYETGTSSGLPTSTATSTATSTPTSTPTPIRAAFDPSTDGLNFNNYSYDGTNARWDDFKRTFPGTTMELADGTHRYGPQRYFESQDYRTIGSGGNCYGFASLSLVRYLGLTETVEQNTLLPANRTLGVSALPGGPTRNVSVGQSDVKDYVHLYQARQSGYERALWYTNHRQDTVATVFQEVQNHTAAQEPVYILIFFNGSGHAMVAYGTEAGAAPNTYSMKVYDSNWPNDKTRRIKVDLTAGTWEYNLINAAQPLIWGSPGRIEWMPAAFVNTNARIFPTYNTSTAAGGAAPSAAAEVRTVSIEGQADLLFTDSEGRQTGYRDGQLVTEIPNLLPMIGMGFNPDNPETSPTQRFLLPSDENYSTEIIARAVTGPLAASNTYTITAIVDDSVMVLGSLPVAGAANQTITFPADARGIVSSSASGGSYCQVITDETDASSRQFDTCVDAAPGDSVSIILDQGGSGVSVENQGAVPVSIEVTASQTGADAQQKQATAVLQPGDAMAISLTFHTYVPFVIRPQ